MSLINKMLQDLDARGAQPGVALPADVLPAPRREASMLWRPVALGVVALVVLGAAGFFGWRHWHGVVAPVPVADATVAPTGKLTPVRNTVRMAPTLAPPAAPAPVAAPAAAPVAAPEPVAVAKTVAPEAAATPAVPAIVRNGTAVAKAAPAPRPAKTAAAEPVAAKPALADAHLSVRQQAENDYRRALNALQDGRVVEAMATLEQALITDPRHSPSRETLVRLLLENNRQDEAVKQMRLSLTLDPQQPAMAMVLARLQVEKDGPAIDTLMRSLPYATANAEYQAFLAALLQRAQRNTEAVEHYQVALGLVPQNGVWWMGLGISLQAAQRLPEARDAYARARDAGGLSPELQAFVERRLGQLGQ